MKESDVSEFKDWVIFTLEMLVTNAEAIQVDVKEFKDDRGTKVQVTVSGPADEIGKIIGRQGQTVEALRRVGYSIARRAGIGYFELLVNGMQMQASAHNGT